MLFFIYSFCGWSIETVCEYIKSRKIVNRGFLIGPICPVYGIGAVLITLVLTRFSNELFVIFGLSAILCGTLEYFTSYLMEKLFKYRWWDYSNYKYNINGRICLETIALFAIAGVVIIRFLNPFIENHIISNISEDVLNYLFYIFITIFIIDIIFTLKVMNKIKEISVSVSSQFKDSTEEISTKVKEIILEKSHAYRRIIEAFPQAFASKVKETTKQISDKAEYVRTKTIENYTTAKEKTIKNLNYAKKITIRNIRLVKIKARKTISVAMKKRIGKNK